MSAVLFCVWGNGCDFTLHPGAPGRKARRLNRDFGVRCTPYGIFSVFAGKTISNCRFQIPVCAGTSTPHGAGQGINFRCHIAREGRRGAWSIL